MSSDPEFEKRINNKIETILETQANLQESIAGLVQVARMHDEQIDRDSARIDRIEKQTEENSKQISQIQLAIVALAEQGKEQQGRIDALIRIVEGHVSNHP